jgi:DNA mismatch repair ATPase MutS
VLLLGPNMGGKSTYLRAAAHAVVLAHVGCYVPAAAGARVGLTDAVFARVGASDDLSAHKSTFMLEMLETADILRNATEASLVVVDEVGRGTSVVDGLSIGLAVLEELAGRTRARTLFASHFPELAVAALRGPAPVRCMRAGAGGGAPASHRVALHPVHALSAGEAGAGEPSRAALQLLGTSMSEGLAVAAHAELPPRVRRRAEAVRGALERSGMPLAWAKAVLDAVAANPN